MIFLATIKLIELRIAEAIIVSILVILSQIRIQNNGQNKIVNAIAKTKKNIRKAIILFET